MRVFDNNLILSQEEIERRLQITDVNAKANCYSFTPTDGGTTHYYVGIDSTHTDAEISALLSIQDSKDLLSFEDYVKSEISSLDVMVRDYVYTKYPNHRQMTLSKLQGDARALGKLEANNYIQTCFDWMQLCFSYYYQNEDAIMTIAEDLNKSEAQKRIDIAQVLSNVNFSSLDALDPLVTIRHAMELLQGV